MKTLAEALGVPDPEKPDEPVKPLPPGTTARSLARSILTTHEYRESILRRVLTDSLAPAVECKLYEYAYGKPVERVQVEDITPQLGELTIEQLEQRAMMLATMARKLRQQEEGPPVGEAVH